MEPVVVAIDGDSKTGKTSLGLSFASIIPRAQPQHYLRHFDLDVGGYNRAIHRFGEEQSSGRLVSKSYFLPQQSVRDKILGSSKARQKQATKLVGIKDLWYDMLTDFVEACEDTNCNSIMFDSWPQVWNLCTMAFLEEKQEKNPGREKLLEIEYGEPNARMRSLIYAARQSGKNLVLISFLTEDYQQRLVNGEIKEVVVGQKPAAWKYTDKEIDVAFRTTTEWIDKPKRLVPHAEVRLCGLALDATGLKFSEPSWGTFRRLIAGLRGEKLEDAI